MKCLRTGDTTSSAAPSTSTYKQGRQRRKENESDKMKGFSEDHIASEEDDATKQRKTIPLDNSLEKAVNNNRASAERQKDRRTDRQTDRHPSIHPFSSEQHSPSKGMHCRQVTATTTLNYIILLTGQISCRRKRGSLGALPRPTAIVVRQSLCRSRPLTQRKLEQERGRCRMHRSRYASLWQTDAWTDDDPLRPLGERTERQADGQPMDGRTDERTQVVSLALC